ncbi:hypothetical protein F5B20DRAFT_302076 [Whalleya microplaca]|nr:hypothetical protein F5B20DRAFT_302076 [Whalleya microplaca]
MAFPSFRRLPTKLKVMIWKHALENESNDRIVPFDHDSFRVLPTASLISPLLLTCWLSRETALKHLNTQISIYRVPRFGTTESYNNIIARLGTGAQLQYTSGNGPVFEQCGYLYLNLSHDNFCLVDQKTFKYRLEASRAITEGRAAGPWKVPLNHLSYAFDAEACLEIQKVHVPIYYLDRQPPISDYKDCKVPPELFFPTESLPNTEQGRFQLMAPTKGEEEINYDLSTLSSLEYREKWASQFVTAIFDHELEPYKWKDPYNLLAPRSNTEDEMQVDSE